MAIAERRHLGDVARIDVTPAQYHLRRIRAYARGVTAAAPTSDDMDTLVGAIAHLTVLAADSDRTAAQRLPGWTPPT